MQKQQMVKQIILLMAMSFFMSACTTPGSLSVDKVAAQKGTFARFSSVKLMPAVFSVSLNQSSGRRKTITYFDRELLIRLSKKLKKQHIIPINDHTSSEVLNIMPRFELEGKLLRLHVVFQDSRRNGKIASVIFDLPNAGQKEVYHAIDNEVLLARLAEQVACYITDSF